VTKLVKFASISVKLPGWRRGI